MHFVSNQICHVYNRGNNKQQIFFNDNNYIFFLKKVRQEWKKYCDILCYCLMPNHFHFMLIPNEEACTHIELGNKLTHMQNLSKTIGKTLSSYTKAINIQNETAGNLFQNKTQGKSLIDLKSKEEFNNEALLTCFNYIHQNHLNANLVTNLKNWAYSSYPDYYEYRNGTLCNKNFAMKALCLTENDFKNEEIVSLNENVVNKIF